MLMDYGTILTCFCLLFAVKGEEYHGDEKSTSNFRGAKAERELAPVDQEQANALKTYIVVYKEQSDADSASLAMANSSAYSIADSTPGGQVVAEYNTVLKGMAVTLTPSAAEQLNKEDNIAFVVEDTPAYLYTTTWGLDRIDQRDFPLDGRYSWEQNMDAGAGVHVCVVDSGIDEDYLGGNDINIGGGEDFTGEPVGVNSWDDCGGHGTHVAGTIGSRLYGVAPGVTLWAARVFRCEGSSTNSVIIQGIEWCAQKARELGGKWVVNMSLGSAYNQAVNMAVGGGPWHKHWAS